MSYASENRKSQQLGMAASTAAGHLRRKIIHMLLERLGENECFVCGLPMTSDDISIEHKEPWLDVDPDLFWDLDNIAFSHKGCNRPHRNNGGPSRRWKDGLLWCRGCEDHRPVDDFNIDKNRNPLSYCRKCAAERCALWRRTGKWNSGPTT